MPSPSDTTLRGSAPGAWRDSARAFVPPAGHGRALLPPLPVGSGPVRVHTGAQFMRAVETYVVKQAEHSR